MSDETERLRTLSRAIIEQLRQMLDGTQPSHVDIMLVLVTEDEHASYMTLGSTLDNETTRNALEDVLEGVRTYGPGEGEWVQ